MLRDLHHGTICADGVTPQKSNKSWKDVEQSKNYLNYDMNYVTGSVVHHDGTVLGLPLPEKRCKLAG